MKSKQATHFIEVFRVKGLSETTNTFPDEIKELDMDLRVTALCKNLETVAIFKIYPKHEASN